ncbi:MAG: hypothetical protein U0324_11085 [Polyangiales bacterium]
MASMRFSNFGGIHQFVVASAADLEQIDALDPARWAATSAPLADLHCDEGFLKYVDAESTGRVRVAQIVRARDWLFERLADREVVKGRHESIKLDAIKDEKLRAAAVRVDREQKAEDASKISLADVRAFKGGYSKFLANGDGVVPPDVVPEAEVAAFLKDVIAVVGSVKDRGGGDGVDTALLEKFKAQGRAYLDWKGKAKAAAAWGDDTAGASALCAKLDAKLEEYFLHCDLLRQEAPAEATLKLKEDEVRALRAKDAAAIEAYLKASPLAAPNARGVLDLNAAVNSLYAADFADLRAKVLGRALGGDVRELTRDAWRKAKGTFDAWRAYESSKPAEPFDPVADKLAAYLDGPLPGRVAHYVELDKAAAPELAEVDNLEKLLLYVRWLVELANNFVNFSAIYRPSETALVEMGSLVIDGRRLDFCVQVHDRAAHKAVASESLIFLVYAKIMEKEAGGATFEVVAPVTGGEKGRLRPGKRGVFYDREGKEWDAQIEEIVENPISVREAMYAPFRRAWAFLNEKFESWVDSASEAQQKALSDKTEEAATTAQRNAEEAAERARQPPPAAPAAGAAPAAAAPASEGLNINALVVGGGVALAGLGAVLAGLVNMLTSLSGWAAILGVVAAVLALSAFTAWLKLRRRDMSVLLEANGWAVNVHTKVTARIAKVFAYTPDLPKGATMDVTDALPEAEDEGGGGGVFFLLLIVAGASLVAWAHFYKHWF